MVSAMEYQKNLVIDFGVKGLTFAAKEANRDEALFNLRKSCESICRIILLNEWGEVDGEKLLSGEIDVFKQSSVKKEEPNLYNLICFIRTLKLTPSGIYNSLDFIRYGGGNKASHSPLNKLQETTQDDLLKCVNHYKKVVEYLWKDVLNQIIPLIFKKALLGEIESLNIGDIKEGVWSDIQKECDYFTKESRYILISPPSFSDVTFNQIKSLAGIKWNFIFDFNPNSQNEGLYEALSNRLLSQNIHPITIKQNSEKGIIGTSYQSLNWLFANGIKSISDSICSNRRDWNRKYVSFIKSLISDYLGNQTHLYTLIFLWDETSYIRSIIELFDELITNTNRVKYIILSDTEDAKNEIEKEFGDYNIHAFCISHLGFIEGIRQSVFSNSDNIHASTFPIPCNDESGEVKYRDLEKRYYSLLERGLSTVYSGIELSDSIQSMDEYSFYKGSVITWKELSDEIDVRRNKKSNLEDRIKSLLERPKGGYIIDLQHKSGGGGTTMGLRLAFDFHKQYPTVMIREYKRNKTGEAIFDIAEFSQKPVLAIVESASVTRNELLKLVTQVNKDKKHVVFLYISRIFTDIKDSNVSVFLPDYMLDIAERNRFITHYSHILPDLISKNKIKELYNQIPSECEIIDFGLTAFDEDFSKDRMYEYLWSYLDKFPKNQLQFAGFVSLIYYYTQKCTSELWFENMFLNNSLLNELNQLPKEKRYFKKLFTTKFDIEKGEFEKEWKPRFSRFSEYIIRLSLCGKKGSESDNWKDFLSQWSVDIIRYIRENNEILTDDIRKMIMSLFLNRDNEEILGVSDTENNISGRKFARILRDIADKDSQMIIFKKLTEAYPLEAHFWGHLGRFIYENAQTENEYEEADEIIHKSLELQCRTPGRVSRAIPASG